MRKLVLLIPLKDTVDAKPLYQYLNDLAKDFAAGKMKMPGIDVKIKATLEKFIGHEQTVAQNQ